MKKSKFTESQIVFALQQAETGVAVAEVCRKLGISEATFYNWKKNSAGWVQRSCAACDSWKKRTAG